jgi:hypothetical protein
MRTERALVLCLNRRLAREGQFIKISRTGPARYLLCDGHTGNLEAWADDLDGWAER